MSKLLGTIKVGKSSSGLFHQVEYVEGGEGEARATVTPVSVGHIKRHKAVRVADELLRLLRRQGIQVNSEGV